MLRERIPSKIHVFHPHEKATFDFLSGLEKMEQYFITKLLRYQTAFGDGSEGETSHNLTLF